MPDTFSSTIFEADYDPAKFIKGVEATVAKLQGMDEKVKQLSTTLQGQRKEYDDNAAKIKTLTQTFTGLEKAESGITKESAAMEAEAKKLKETNEALSKTIAAQAADMVKLKSTHDTLQASYDKVRSKAKEFSDVAGKPVLLALPNDGEVIKKLQSLRTQFVKTFDGLTLDSDFNEAITKAVTSAKGEFETIGRTVDLLKEKLVTLDPGTQEFNEVAAAIRVGDQVLDEYTRTFDAATKQVSTGETVFKSLRSRLKELRDELTKLEEAGQEETEQYRRTQLEAAKLTDQYGDMQQRIRILASDTKYLDFGVAALQTAAGAYQSIIGIQTAFGLSTEDSAKTQAKLLAVMNLVQGVQQLSNALLKENILRTTGADIVSKAYAATQRILAVSLGASATAARVLSAALVATGIGALVVGIGVLISVMNSWSEETEKAKKIQDQLTESIERQNKAIGYELDALDFAGKLREEKLKQQGAKKIALLRQQGASEETIQKAQAANESKLFDQSQTALLNKVQTYTERIEELRQLSNGATGEARKKADDQLFKLEDDKNKTLQAYDLNAEKQRTKIAEDGTKKRNATRSAENVYAKELARLREELAKASAKEFTSDDTISATFTASLEKQFNAIADYVKKKQLTTSQAANLKGIIRQIIDLDQKKTLDDFHKQVEEIREGILDSLEDLRFQEAEQRAGNIQHEFERETKLILIATQKQKSDLRKESRNIFDELAAEFKIGKISKNVYDSAVEGYTALFAKQLEDINTQTAQKNAALAEKIFSSSLDELETTVKNTNLAISESATAEINSASQQYLKGEISYAAYQKRLTNILKEEAQKRKQEQLKTIDEEIKAIVTRLATTTLSPEAQKAELARLHSLEEQYNSLNREIAGEKVANKNDAANQRLQRFQTYLGYVNSFVSSIGQAWQAATDAEQKSIERSIALQDKRVEAATKIAERGNATYLKMEEERQQELIVKQENAARRQIAINAAIQASQLLVAVASAAASIAIDPSGVSVIKNLALIIGALASGYALVKSLQDNQPSFYQGETYVQSRRDARKNIARLDRTHERPGRDTIPAWLDEGEAVTDAATNKKYHPTIKAIHEGTIPPDVINNVVQNYDGNRATKSEVAISGPIDQNPLIKAIREGRIAREAVNGVVNHYQMWKMPQLNVKRMEQAISVKVSHDHQLLEATRENTREVKRLRKDLAAKQTSISLDSRGLSVEMAGHMAQINLNKKS